MNFVALTSTGLHSDCVNILNSIFMIFKQKSFYINICKAKTKKLKLDNLENQIYVSLFKCDPFM